MTDHCKGIPADKKSEFLHGLSLVSAAQGRKTYLIRFTPVRAAVSNCPVVDKYVFVWFANTKGKELGKHGSGHLGQVWMERPDFCLIAFKDLECCPMRKYDIRCAMVHDGPVPQCEKNELATIITALESGDFVLMMKRGTFEEALHHFESKFQ